MSGRENKYTDQAMHAGRAVIFFTRSHEATETEYAKESLFRVLSALSVASVSENRKFYLGVCRFFFFGFPEGRCFAAGDVGLAGAVSFASLAASSFLFITL